MILKNTKLFMENKIKNQELDSYAVLVCKNGEKEILTSSNVDEFTYFDIASMGKVLITSTLVLQAIDSGLLNLEDTMETFFEAVPEEKKKITVRQLLTHTSGIIRHPITKEAVDNGKNGIAAEMLSHPLAYEPGTSYIYSCAGFILLGFILEKIYGQTLKDIYNEKLYKPLNLKRTSFEIGFDEPNAAVCYHYPDIEKLKHRFDDENVQMMGEVAGSGGEQSCLYDIDKFIEAVIAKDERLYSKKWFELAEKNYTPDYSEGRGLGYLVVDEKYPQTGKLFPIGSFGHCGHCGQSFFINRKENLYVIILSNATRFSYIKNNFSNAYYDEIMEMRQKIHNSILSDLS